MSVKYVTHVQPGGGGATPRFWTPTTPQLTVGRRPLWRGGGGGGGGLGGGGGGWEGMGFWEGVVLVGAPGRGVHGGGCRAPPNSWVCGPGVI